MSAAAQRSRRLAALTLTSIVLMGAGSLVASPRLIVWNASESMPVGFYRRTGSSMAQTGDIVLVWLPKEARTLAGQRNYLSSTVPALKPIAAMTGDIVCAHDDQISINETIVATRLTLDRHGRDLPRWTGCKTLTADDVFLLSNYAPDSFDGRYFGPTKASEIIEKVTPLWTF